MSYFYIRTEWDFVLARVCYINKWEQTTRKCWETDKGSWHALDYDELRDLNYTFKALIKMAKETERQWIIEANGLDFIRKILAWPSTEEKLEHKEIMSSAWDLLFELADDSSNHALIWSEFNRILMKHLRQKVYDNDACRHIVYRIYGISHIAQHEGLNIFQILINHFHKAKQNGPLKEQGLTLFLQHFMMDERSISLMYEQLKDVEKKCFLHFIVDCISRPLTDYIMDYRVSSELLDCICNEFISKNELISLSSVPENSKVELLFSLFEAIAYAATDERHQLNKFNFPLVLNVVHLFHYVRTHDYIAEFHFGTIQRNTKIPLKEIILSTIINLVRDNADHKEKAREAGLIEILVNYVSRERCRYLYKCMLYALIEMCQTSPLNMALVEEIAKSKDWTGSVAVADFLYDMNYKGEKIY
ncbi:uncharacterized protein LOC119067870 [Bradysia coprophila]|uniref:uncharacterized protein LOC119067870 n=1 Tax=Bradysia coprophila TaxID=38358 RepID=UPI00187D9D92|nr:uncharacterized protein LOC119067870 [Bradysia coprophila]